MKQRFYILLLFALLFFALIVFALSACGAGGGAETAQEANDALTDGIDTTADSGANIQDNQNSVGDDAPQAAPNTEPPADSPPDTPSGGDPSGVDVPAAPTPPALSYDDAFATCQAWFYNHADMAGYFIFEFDPNAAEYASYNEDGTLRPPPEYAIFREQYYAFAVSNTDPPDCNTGAVVLVHADTGEMLVKSAYNATEGRTVTIIEDIDSWYNNVSQDRTFEIPEGSPAESKAKYDAWLESWLKDGDFSEDTKRRYAETYSINLDTYEYYCISDVWYHRFFSQIPEYYHYNILVNIQTGEVLNLGIYDGMFAGTDILSIDDWRKSWFR